MHWAQHSALEEDHLQDQGCDCGEREPYQHIYDPDCDPPAAFPGGPGIPRTRWARSRTRLLASWIAPRVALEE